MVNDERFSRFVSRWRNLTVLIGTWMFQRGGDIQSARLINELKEEFSVTLLRKLHVMCSSPPFYSLNLNLALCRADKRRNRV